MKTSLKITITILFLGFSFILSSQSNSLELNPEKEKKFTPYMLSRHGGPEGLADFKKTHPHDYLLELWYYSESFYIKRNYFKEGYVLDDAVISVERFESSRKENEEAIIILEAFKDVIVLLPSNQLIYKPDQK